MRIKNDMITDILHQNNAIESSLECSMVKKATGACVFLICALLVSGQPVTSDEDPLIECDKGDSCTQCYKSLVAEVLSRDSNVYNLQQAFFAPSGSVPVFVTVRYHYVNEFNHVMNPGSPVVYFWSSAIYFFFHPVKIFQFTSLLFSDPELQTESLDLQLDASCNGTSEEYMTLLTQRLKLYAMHQKFTAPIDDTYKGRSHTSGTLKIWYKSNENIDALALAAQFLVPLLMMVYVIFFFIYLLELKPYEIGKDIEKELKSRTKKIRAKADANLLIKITISLLFHILIFAADSMAFVEYGKLSDEIHDYYYAAPWYFWSVPIVMIIFDGLWFLIIYTLVPIIARFTKKWYRLTYCMLSPIACVFTHCYHIIFAFIDNPYHATSILLLYAMILFVHVLGFQQVHYFINHFWEWKNKNPGPADQVALEVPQENDTEEIIIDRQRICKNCVTFICFIVLFIVTGVSVGLSLALLTLLPITNAIDDAPNRLYVIYQASVTFFAALIAFQVIFRHNNSPFAFLIKAQEMCDTKELDRICGDKEWKDKSEKEREIYLVRKVILAIEKLASDNIKQDYRNGGGNPPRAPEKQPEGIQKPSQGSAGVKVAVDVHSEGGGGDKQPLLQLEQ